MLRRLCKNWCQITQKLITGGESVSDKMSLRRILTAAGAGVTTFLLVAVLVIELLDFEFSAIIGLPVGLLAGFAVFGILWVRLPELTPGVRRIASAAATFGLTILLLLVLRYVNLGRELLSVDLMVTIALAGAVVVFALLWLTDREIV